MVPAPAIVPFDPAAAPRPIAYIFTTFPKETESFLQREIIALRAAGVPLRLYSMWGGKASFRGLPVIRFPKWRLVELLWAVPLTLLIWVYDEHGGYYEHVSPPAAMPPDDIEGHSVLDMPAWVKACLRPFFGKYIAELEAADAGSMRYDRYGFRVPAVIVSPYARPDYVCSEVLDHTSVLKLVEQKWNLPPLTRRDAAAASPLAALSLDSPPAFLPPPELPGPAVPWASWHPGGRRRGSSRRFRQHG